MQAAAGSRIAVGGQNCHWEASGAFTGLAWAAALEPPATHLATFACDMPLAPADIVRRLIDAAGAAPASIAACAGVRHPTLGVWSVTLASAAAASLAKGARSLRGFADAVGAAIVNFPPEEADAFVNVNTAANLAALAAHLAARPPG